MDAVTKLRTGVAHILHQPLLTSHRLEVIVYLTNNSLSVIVPSLREAGEYETSEWERTSRLLDEMLITRANHLCGETVGSFDVACHHENVVDIMCWLHVADSRCDVGDGATGEGEATRVHPTIDEALGNSAGIGVTQDEDLRPGTTRRTRAFINSF